MVRYRVRIRFAKREDLRWIGHRDLMRCCERWFRRAALPLAFSEGFHPKPRMTFPSALALGIAAENEVMELELSEPIDCDVVRLRLSCTAPPGLVVRHVETASGKLRVRAAEYVGRIPCRWCGELPQRIAELLSAQTCIVSRGQDRSSIDVRPLIDRLELREDRLEMRLSFGSAGSAGPREILAALGFSDDAASEIVFTRTNMILDSETPA